LLTNNQIQRIRLEDEYQGKLPKAPNLKNLCQKKKQEKTETAQVPRCGSLPRKKLAWVRNPSGQLGKGDPEV